LFCVAVMAMVKSVVVGQQHIEYPIIFWKDTFVKHHHYKWKGHGAIDRYNKYMKRRVHGEGGGYGPPRLKDLKKQNRTHTQKFYSKKKNTPMSVPRAPFNDSSFLMRVQRSGGLGLSTSLVSPSPTSLLSSPACSEYKLDACENIVDQNDYGYGSMTGFIHLCHVEDGDQSSRDNNNGSCVGKCVEQQESPYVDYVQKLELQLDRDVSRFEMTPLLEQMSKELMEQRVMRQDVHIAHLEDENLVLKERLFLIQQEVDELKQRLQGGERCNNLNIESYKNDEFDDMQSYFAK